jgi:hypothetical protein
MQIGEYLRHFTPEYPQQGELGSLDDRDLDAGLSRGGGDLETDPAGTDHNELSYLAEQLP